MESKITDGDIRAAFDGEGSLTRHKQGNHLVWQLTISNGDRDWLHLVHRYLTDRGYHAKVITSLRQRAWGVYMDSKVYLSRLPEITRFLDEFPSLMPKRAKRIAEFRAYNMIRPGSGGKR